MYSYVKTYKIPAIVTNCSNNYGPKQHPEKLIPKLIYNILNNKPLPIYGKGTNSREWIYVKDHCEALIKVFQNGKVGEFYNIGSNKNLNNLNVCKKLIKVSKNINLLGKKVKINFNLSYLIIAKTTMLNNEYQVIKETLFQDFKKIR